MMNRDLVMKWKRFTFFTSIERCVLWSDCERKFWIPSKSNQRKNKIERQVSARDAQIERKKEHSRRNRKKYSFCTENQYREALFSLLNYLQSTSQQKSSSLSTFFPSRLRFGQFQVSRSRSNHSVSHAFHHIRISSISSLSRSETKLNRYGTLPRFVSCPPFW